MKPYSSNVSLVMVNRNGKVGYIKPSDIQKVLGLQPDIKLNLSTNKAFYSLLQSENSLSAYFANVYGQSEQMPFDDNKSEEQNNYDLLMAYHLLAPH